MAAAYSAEGSLAATGAKKAGREFGKELVGQTVKHADDIIEAGAKQATEVLEAGTRKGIKETAEALAKPKGPPGKVITKSADEIAEAISKKQKQLIDDVENGKIELEGYEGHKKGNHTRKSNYGEMKMDEYMRKLGYEPLHNQIDNIDQSITKGIDGVYRHPGPPPKYAIGEAKYNTSTLSQGAKDGPQMSDDWINGNITGKNRLIDAVGRQNAREINIQGFDRILIHTDKAGRVTTSQLNELGEVIGRWN